MCMSNHVCSAIINVHLTVVSVEGFPLPFDS